MNVFTPHRTPPHPFTQVTWTLLHPHPTPPHPFPPLGEPPPPRVYIYIYVYIHQKCNAHAITHILISKYICTYLTSQALPESTCGPGCTGGPCDPGCTGSASGGASGTSGGWRLGSPIWQLKGNGDGSRMTIWGVEHQKIPAILVWDFWPIPNWQISETLS